MRDRTEMLRELQRTREELEYFGRLPERDELVMRMKNWEGMLTGECPDCADRDEEIRELRDEVNRLEELIISNL